MHGINMCYIWFLEDFGQKASSALLLLSSKISFKFNDGLKMGFFNDEVTQQ